MTTDPHDEHGEILRRALHAEADTVNPAGDGLERIRARIADGRSRRFGLGRFGPARFGWDRFTVGWARPVLAVAAAVVVAGLGVTAPQTIDLIQQSVGNSGPSGGAQNNTDGDRAAAPGNPEFPEPPSAGGTPSGSPSTSATTSTSSSPGLSSCRIPPPAGTAPASPGTAATPTPATTPCPSETPTQAPTTPPPSTPTTPPTSQKPTDTPTQPPASTPAGTSDEGSGTTP
ncbi:hypothetical protein SAMN05443665_100179 [Actinomadura meyerae]|jgi:hypothetical protein|uniref:Uncharacterized protein n=1 Tax=Actinomadura meyerae TaxID=240840 RepID=A0A239BV87_9ACTN|nr:hypothetical protein [Actinomadura meyerae]SNS11955.1 hypothetical protein SAMN05443665_100179 [Actinomadura meyerae]